MLTLSAQPQPLALPKALLCPADVLLDLMASRRFEVFVHCVAPVLDATRHVVVLFNQLLKKRVRLSSLDVIQALRICLVFTLSTSVHRRCRSSVCS